MSYRNQNVYECSECHQIIGFDQSWNYHGDHDNLACRWLGWTVKFDLGGQEFEGEVIETKRHFLANGVHDILTVEFFDRGRQLKLQGHRQSFTRIGANPNDR